MKLTCKLARTFYYHCNETPRFSTLFRLCVIHMHTTHKRLGICRKATKENKNFIEQYCVNENFFFSLVFVVVQSIKMCLAIWRYRLAPIHTLFKYWQFIWSIWWTAKTRCCSLTTTTAYKNILIATTEKQNKKETVLIKHTEFRVKLRLKNTFSLYVFITLSDQNEKSVAACIAQTHTRTARARNSIWFFFFSRFYLAPFGWFRVNLRPTYETHYTSTSMRNWKLMQLLH